MKIQSITSYHLAFGISTLVERALQIAPFLTNKANFPKSQMNLSIYEIMDYEQMDTCSIRKNKAKTNPIQIQFKAKTKPKQSQFKPKQSQFQDGILFDDYSFILYTGALYKNKPIMEKQPIVTVNTKKFDITATFACLGTLSFWAFGPIFIKYLAGYIDSWTQNLLRYSAGCLFWLRFPQSAWLELLSEKFSHSKICRKRDVRIYDFALPVLKNPHRPAAEINFCPASLTPGSETVNLQSQPCNL